MWLTSDWEKSSLPVTVAMSDKKLRTEHELNTHKHMLIKLQTIALINISKYCIKHARKLCFYREIQTNSSLLAPINKRSNYIANEKVDKERK